MLDRIGVAVQAVYGRGDVDAVDVIIPCESGEVAERIERAAKHFLIVMSDARERCCADFVARQGCVVTVRVSRVAPVGVGGNPPL